MCGQTTLGGRHVSVALDRSRRERMVTVGSRSPIRRCPAAVPGIGLVRDL